MKQVLLTLAALISISHANADSPQAWFSQTAICASGEVNPSSPFARGSGVWSAPGVRFFVESKKGTVLETDKQAVVTVVSRGTKDSDCMNGGNPTILIVIMNK